MLSVVSEDYYRKYRKPRWLAFEGFICRVPIGQSIRCPVVSCARPWCADALESNDHWKRYHQMTHQNAKYLCQLCSDGGIAK